MPEKTRKKIEFGDFQTPEALAHRVCAALRRRGVSPAAIVEPTCGTGAFLRAATAAFTECSEILGFDVNPQHVKAAASVEKAEVRAVNFFEKDWKRTLDALPNPILVIGNPPWVTNSTVGTLGGANLPVKSNSHNLNGFDAITGKSNFDISEWMILHLLKCLSGRDSVLAMLCKTAVARKVLRYAWSRGLQLAKAETYRVDASRHFGAAVDACLLVCFRGAKSKSRECAVYSDLEAKDKYSAFGLRHGRLVADLDAADRYGHLCGSSPLRWRSGVKHDCAQVMEMRAAGRGRFRNGLGETPALETMYLYPALKSSELFRPHPTPSRYMLVTQRSIGEDTRRIERKAPRTWNYLRSHADALDRRASSIYRNRPRFSVFGVGPYTFSPWKVAISGLCKKLAFRRIGPVDGKPVVFDDTCYFLSCRNEKDAGLLAGLLDSEAAEGFFRSFVFWDSKRPITAQILGDLDLGALAGEAGMSLPARWDQMQDGLSLDV